MGIPQLASSTMKTSLVVLAALSSARAFTIIPRSGSLVPVAGVFSSSTARHMSTTSPMEFAKTEIDSNDVVVFSKSYCPYCTATKTLLKDMSIDFTLYELDQMDNGADIQAALLEMSGQRTVPNVFIKGQHLGGNDKTQAAAKSGKLQEMLQ